MQVAYLVSQFPAISHVFIEREVAGLRALGLDVRTFSVRPTPAEQLISESMRADAVRTTTLLGDRRALVAATGSLLAHDPRAYARVLRLAARSGPRTARGRVWQLFYLTEAVRLHAEMSRAGVRHLHVHFSNNAADVARLVVALGRAVDGPDAGWRWTMTVHGPTEFEAVEHFDLAAKVVDADAVACISDFTRSQLMRLVPTSHWEKLAVVRMSVDADRFEPSAVRTPSAADEELRILSVGRLVPEKGAPLLVDAVELLRERGWRPRLRLVGAGPLHDELAATIDSRGLGDCVELTGALGQDRLPELYVWADVFCLPSFQEGLPVVLMEALATATPVVTTAIAGIPELVDADCGRVVPAGRVDLLAEALAELLGDAALRERLGAAGRRRVLEQFSLPVTARSQAAFLRAVEPRAG
ncbi:colanic acid biosynthesis glycosyltransferase WcaL [Nocardioides mangrovicus]|uniref:Colanic acid biosynthesis glycosyltransferase WcaL n=1 Tax=Nocardioides mangrovicus TaxID=2478913 RepID=A0A3L8P343_9ACTN|nr:glycosyltransferase family 4 protein [Nocardioides mangrovicus]RLV49461.1 colanic acid biosynthesis glycosyltransferase WcaL [Nocardioides mangrovicus]